jgi:hypothetical protein
LTWPVVRSKAVTAVVACANDCLNCEMSAVNVALTVGMC